MLGLEEAQPRIHRDLCTHTKILSGAPRSLKRRLTQKADKVIGSKGQVLVQSPS